MKKVKVPVYIQTVASSYIGNVEIEHESEFFEAADKLWEEKQYESPTVCHQCGDEIELGDFEIAEDTLSFYFEKEQ